jgi:vancomycin aglycone glucosyltransferase
MQIPLALAFVAPAQALAFGVYLRLVHQMLANDINRHRYEMGLPEVTAWNAWAEFPRRYLGFWPSWYVSVGRILGTDVLPVGLSQIPSGKLSKDRELKSYLDVPERAVLITGGTANWSRAREFYSVAAKAVDASGRPGILVCPDLTVLPEDLPESTTVFSWLPFDELISHVDGVLHHGGASLILKTIALGKPQIALPYGADRPVNAQCMARLGLGEVVEMTNWNVEKVLGLIQTVFASSLICARCKQVAVSARDTEPSESDAACIFLEDLARRE